MSCLVNQLFFPIKLSNVTFRANDLNASSTNGLRKSFGLCNSRRSIACSCVASPTNLKSPDEFSASNSNALLYPGAVVNGLSSNMSLPIWGDVLNIYNLTHAKEASPVADLQRLEISKLTVD